jgi:hypothetical protein
MALDRRASAGRRQPTSRAIDGLENALAGLDLLDDALALDLRRPQDYFQRIWNTALAFPGSALGDVGPRPNVTTTKPSSFSEPIALRTVILATP